MNWMTLADHYPKPENRPGILGAMKRINGLTKEVSGLVLDGAWIDEKGDQIVAVALWESREAADAGSEQVKSCVMSTPLDQWSRQPRDPSLFGIPQAA